MAAPSTSINQYEISAPIHALFGRHSTVSLKAHNRSNWRATVLFRVRDAKDVAPSSGFAAICILQQLSFDGSLYGTDYCIGVSSQPWLNMQELRC